MRRLVTRHLPRLFPRRTFSEITPSSQSPPPTSSPPPATPPSPPPPPSSLRPRDPTPIPPRQGVYVPGRRATPFIVTIIGILIGIIIWKREEIEEHLIRRELSRLEVLLKEEDYSSLLDASSSFLQSHPKHPHALYLRAVARLLLGQPLPSLPDLEVLSESEVWGVRSLILATRAFIHLHLYQEALEVSVEATRREPTNPHSWHARGLAEEKLGKNEEALESMRRAKRLITSSGSIDSSAWHHSSIEDHSSLYANDINKEKSFKNMPMSIIWAEARLLLALNRPQDALGLLTHLASSLSPSSPLRETVVIELAQTLNRLGHWEATLSLTPTHPHILLAQANAMEHLGRLDAANALREQAAFVFPQPT